MVLGLDDVLIRECTMREIQVRDFTVRKNRCGFVYHNGGVFCVAQLVCPREK